MVQVDTRPMADAIKMIGGGLVGAGLALLLAPQSGRETRRGIIRYAKTFGGRTHHAVYDFGNSLGEFIDSIGEKANEILNSDTEMSEEAKRGLLTALERGQERLERQKRKLAQMIA